MKNRKNIGIAIMCIFMILSIFNTGITLWDKYKNDSIKMQKEQLQNVSYTLSAYLKQVISYNCNTLNYKAKDFKFEYNNKEDLIILDEEGKHISKDDCEEVLGNRYGVSKITEDIELVAYDNDDKFSTVLLKKLENNKSLGVVIDLQQHYKELISRIKVGTNGYIVVKNEDGMILMHPEEVQLGINLIDGREEIYPGVDLTSLENLREFQSEKKSGVMEYESYWWTKEDVPSAKKIAAHTQVEFGKDFLIVSAVMDHDDIYLPLEEGFSQVITMLLVSSVIMLLFFIYVGYLIIKDSRNKEEIIYLRELNDVLEETKRTEETISHQQRLQIMGTMTGGIAHEFNNLLTPIIGYAELLKLSTQESTEEYEYIDEILKSADGAKDIIRNISRLSRRNIETIFNFKTCSQLYIDIRKMLYPQIPSNITLIENFEVRSNVGILCNETQLYQVILNLCVNAFHAIGSKDRGIVELNCREENESIVIEVKDNGCGMEQIVIEQIFNPFFTTKIGEQGTGLGLSIVDQIINSHKGKIKVKSKVDVGTTFKIKLPLVVEQSINIEKDYTNENIKVIVIGDNEKVLRLIKRNLENHDMKVDTCNCAEDALVMIEKELYDVVLIDNQLSYSREKRDGLNVAELITVKSPNLKKIIMVEEIRKEVIDAKQRGFINEFIEKPVSVNFLIDSIHKMLNLKKM